MRNSSETINILRVSKICIMQWQNRNNKRIVRITWNHFLFLLWWKEQKICYQVKIIFYNQENITKQTKFRNIFTRTWKWTYLQLACTSLQSQNCTLLSHPSLQTQKSLGLEPDTSFFFYKTWIWINSTISYTSLSFSAFTQELFYPDSDPWTAHFNWKNSEMRSTPKLLVCNYLNTEINQVLHFPQVRWARIYTSIGIN